MMRGLAKDSALILAERSIRAGVAFVMAVLCARMLGPSDYGVYSYALALVALTAFVGQAGLEPILVREFVDERAADGSTLASALLLRLLGSLLAALASLTIARTTSSTTGLITALVAVLGLAGVLQSLHIVDYWLQAKGLFRVSSLAKACGVVVCAVGRIAVLWTPAPLLGLAAVAVCESVFTAVLLWAAASRNGLSLGSGMRRPTKRSLRHLLSMSHPILLSGLAIAVYSRADVFLLGQVRPSAEVGHYTAATSLSGGLYLFPVALMTAAAPRLMALHRADQVAFRRECGRMIRYCSLTGFAAALGLSVFAKQIITLTYGPLYANASTPLAVHAWSTWMVFISVASEPWYVAHNLQRIYLLKTTLAASTNLALNIALIPRLGPTGAALTCVVSYAMSAFVCNGILRVSRPLFFLQLRSMLFLPERTEGGR